VNGSPIDSAKGQRGAEVAYRNAELKKYCVDLLGNYKEVKQEKRIPGRFKGEV